MVTINEIYDFLDSIAPFENAQEWDNSGILVKSSSRYINKVALVLDATCDVIKKAAADGCELIITHHSIIFEPKKVLDFSSPAELCLSLGVSVISAHTNLDVSSYGADALFSKTLQEKIGFIPTGLAEQTGLSPMPIGFGRTGELKDAISFDALISAVGEILSCDGLRLVRQNEQIKTLSFCCGAGASLIDQKNIQDTDAYITSDVKHSTFISAKNNCISLIVPTHYQMEKPAMVNLMSVIKEEFQNLTVVRDKFETPASYAL